MADLYRSAPAEARVRDWCRSRLDRWDEPHEVSVVETSLGATHLTLVGGGPDTCVYLPGTNFNAATSTRVLSVLGRTFRVVCADLPGQPGLSAATRPGDEVAGYRRWVGEVLAHVCSTLPAGRVVLVGHSRGAAVALTAAPEDVDALALLSPAGLARVRLTPTVVVRSLAWLLRPDRRRTQRLVALMSGGPGCPTVPDEVVEWLELIGRATRTTGAPGPLPAELVGRWRGFPVAALAGAHDVFFPPARLAPVARRRLGVPVETVPAAGHLLTDQHPDRVADRVHRLLGE